jgi:hypothetical protein
VAGFLSGYEAGWSFFSRSKIFLPGSISITSAGDSIKIFFCPVVGSISVLVFVYWSNLSEVPLTDVSSVTAPDSYAPSFNLSLSDLMSLVDPLACYPPVITFLFP